MCSDFKITFMWDNSTLNFLCRGQGGNAKLMSMTCIIRVSAWVDEEYTFSQTQGSLNWNRKITFGMQIYLLLIYLSKNDLLSTYPMPSTVVQLNSFFFFFGKFPCYSFRISHPLLSSPHVHKSIFSMSVIPWLPWK